MKPGPCGHPRTPTTGPVWTCERDLLEVVELVGMAGVLEVVRDQLIESEKVPFLRSMWLVLYPFDTPHQLPVLRSDHCRKEDCDGRGQVHRLLMPSVFPTSLFSLYDLETLYD